MEKLLKQIEYNKGRFPKKALEEIIERKEEAIPALLSIVSNVRDNPKKYLQKQKQGYFAHIYAFYLLAQFRVEEFYPILVDILRLPSETIDELLGDVLTEAGGRMLASVCGENINPIKEMIEDREVDGYVRGEALQALTILALNDTLPREEVIKYFQLLLRGGLKDKHPHVMADIVYGCDRLYPEEVYDDIKYAFDQKLVAYNFINLDDINHTLKNGKEKTIIESKKNVHLQPIHDWIKDMKNWLCFYEDYKEAQQSRMVNKMGLKHHIKVSNSKTFIKEMTPGRNDPCPCGSGKKFKKCCGK